MKMDRRHFLQLTAAGGGAVFASALPGCASFGTPVQSSFTVPFVNWAMATIWIAGKVNGIIAPPPAKAYVPPPK